MPNPPPLLPLLAALLLGLTTAGPLTPTGPTTAANPVTAAIPVAATNPTTAANPITAANPATIINSATAANQAAATNPVLTANPVAATNPTTAANPITAANPATTINSATAANQAAATNPVLTANPVAAASPATLTNPATRVNPAKPAGPAKPAHTAMGGAGAALILQPPSDVPAFSWPISPPQPVVRPFEAPSSPYGPGHRGVDLAGAPGAPVVAAADGVVAFAGTVAGRGVVSIDHLGGLRTTYEPLEVLVAAGQQVTRGAVIGHLLPGHPGCQSACLHWGVRRGAEYLDPLGLLTPGRVRLLPWGEP